jgi:hypothetical protein
MKNGDIVKILNGDTRNRGRIVDKSSHFLVMVEYVDEQNQPLHPNAVMWTGVDNLKVIK